MPFQPRLGPLSWKSERISRFEKISKRGKTYRGLACLEEVLWEPLKLVLSILYVSPLGSRIFHEGTPNTFLP